jgi:hypothetical protein
MIDPKDFYSTFQVNYFDYKQAYQSFALNHINEFGLEDKILDYSEKDFRQAIKSDIRQTLFHAIETVFDLVFALTKTRGGKYLDVEILRTLSIPTFYYDRISKIADNKEELDFLDEAVNLNDSISVSLCEYIFFFGAYVNQDFRSQIDDSLDAIKSALYILAKEFSDRKEYNSYKHGLRIVPALTYFILQNPATKKNLAKWDLTDSLTYYSENEKSGKMDFITKVFDTDRDLRLTSLCSNLIWNIIKLRDLAFNKKNPENNVSLKVILFNKEIVADANKINTSFLNLRISQTIRKNQKG